MAVAGPRRSDAAGGPDPRAAGAAHDGGWATFLRNHDELSLDKLTAAEQHEVHAAFAPDEDMRVYGHGIRRRVASMLGGDGPRLRMAWSLLYSLPGTPVMLYGDEIGLQENLSLKERLSVRVPMDFDAVADQRRDPDSLLTFVSKLMHARREAPEFGWGTRLLLENDPPALFAHRCDWDGSSVIAAHNLGGEPVEAEVEVGEDVTGATTCSNDDGSTRRRPIEAAARRLGFRWLRPRR